jgi:hypothetical protein
VLKVKAKQEAAESIGAPSNLAFQRVEFLWIRHDPWCFLHWLQLVEGFLYLSGVIAILTGQTRITCHGHAPLGGNSLEHHR